MKNHLTNEVHRVRDLPLSHNEHQVTSNVAIGRSHLGVHWRMDGVFGAEMGEASAIRRLQQVGGCAQNGGMLQYT